jgi:sortase A
MRLRNLIVVLAALLMVAALAACGGGETSDANQQTTPQEQVAPNEGGENTNEEQAQAPEDKSLKLTVPKMERIDNADIPTGEGSATQMFKENAAVHLQGTGYPWEEEANVYIAGHRLGYPGTDSYLAFNDIEALQNGDEVVLEDSEGGEYTYEVFNTVVVEPTNLSVLDTVEGKNIVSLQSCTLPDYSDRIIVQAELKDQAA